MVLCRFEGDASRPLELAINDSLATSIPQPCFSSGIVFYCVDMSVYLGVLLRAWQLRQDDGGRQCLAVQLGRVVFVGGGGAARLAVEDLRRHNHGIPSGIELHFSTPIFGLLTHQALENWN